LYLKIRGNQFLSLGEPEKARPLLAEALNLDPSSPRTALSYGHVLFGLKDYRSVVELLTPFYEKGHAEVLELLGRSCQALGDFRQAISHYQAFLSHFGAHYQIFVLMGDCYLQSGQTAEAVRAWERSLEINPNQEEVKKRIDSLRR
jgi:tetratricopeptide (TPR) repeat protein